MAQSNAHLVSSDDPHGDEDNIYAGMPSLSETTKNTILDYASVCSDPEFRDLLESLFMARRDEILRHETDLDPAAERYIMALDEARDAAKAIK